MDREQQHPSPKGWRGSRLSFPAHAKTRFTTATHLLHHQDKAIENFSLYRRKTFFSPLWPDPEGACGGMLLLILPRACFSTSGHGFALRNSSRHIPVKSHSPQGQELTLLFLHELKKGASGELWALTLLTPKSQLAFPLCSEGAGAQTDLGKGFIAASVLPLQEGTKHQSSSMTKPGLPFPISQGRQGKTLQTNTGPKGCSLQVWSCGLAAATSQNGIHFIHQDISTAGQRHKPTAHTEPLTETFKLVFFQKRV